MHKFKAGDRVKILYGDKYAYGEVTIATDTKSKVIWDGEYDLDYWYYDNNDLELMIEKEEKKNEQNL